ncbi:MAG: CRISPR-associated CARF protein Csx1 [Desulfurococcaceae archaeon]
MSDNVLLMSVWGYPPQWTKYRYVVSIEHSAHKSLGESECESCCTTFAVASHLKKKYNVRVLVFGVDTVVNPSESKNIRSEALSLYEKWLKELSERDNCSCCDLVFNNSKILEIHILPGLGHYYGWHFKASMDNVFVQSFSKIFKELSNERYKWIFLDLTHGLNYLLIAVLYATVANAVLFGMESRLILVNSEPARAGNKKCIKAGDVRVEEIESLSILDVSRLQLAVNLIRSLTALKYFQPLQLGAVFKELRERSPQIERELAELERVLPFFKLLGNTITGPTFVNSYINGSNGIEEPLSTALCRNLDNEKKDLQLNEEFNPNMNPSSRAVEYAPTSIFRVLPTALKKIVNDVCSELVAGDGDKYLNKYLGKIAGYYEKSGSIYSSLIVENTREDLGKVIDFVVENVDVLKECFSSSDLISTGNTEIGISGILFRAISSKPRDDLNKIAESIKGVKTDCENLSKLLEIENIRKEYREIHFHRSSSNLDRILRNMCAHAGLEYTSIKKMVIDVEKKDIVKIVYDRELLFRILGYKKIIDLKEERNENLISIRDNSTHSITL